MDHRSTITNFYNEVKFSLTTHSKGNSITESERKLAAAVEPLKY